MLAKERNTLCAVLRRSRSVLMVLCLLATMLLPSFYAMADSEVLAGHVSTSGSSLYTLTSGDVAVESGKAYTLTMNWKTEEGTTASIVVKDNGSGVKTQIMQGAITAQNGASFDPKTGEVTYTFTPSGDTVSIRCNTYNEAGTVYGKNGVALYFANPTLTKVEDGSTVDISVEKWTCSENAGKYTTVSLEASSFAVPGYVSALHVSGGTANGVSVSVPAQDGAEYTLSMYWKSDYATPGVYVEGTNIITGNTSKADTANFDPATGLLTYTFTASGTEVSLDANTYAGGELTGDVHFYMADLVLTKTADSTATSIPVSQLKEWYGGINLEYSTLSTTYFIANGYTPVLHISGGTANGVSVSVPAEDGAEYTLSMYWKSDYATPGVYVGSSNILAGTDALTDTAAYDPSTGLLTYTFTANTSTVTIGAATYIGGEMTGDVHFYMADLVLTKTANNTSVDIPVSTITAWYGGINLEYATLSTDFFASASGPQVLGAQIRESDNAFRFVLSVKSSFLENLRKFASVRSVEVGTVLVNNEKFEGMELIITDKTSGFGGANPTTLKNTKDFVPTEYVTNAYNDYKVYTAVITQVDTAAKQETEVAVRAYVKVTDVNGAVYVFYSKDGDTHGGYVTTYDAVEALS